MKVLVSGCSYTHNIPWPEHLFKSHEVLNLGQGAASNLYIANSVMYNIDYKPDFVYVLWSGINRIDLRVPISPMFDPIRESTTFCHDMGESLYFFSGHDFNPERGWLAAYKEIKDPSWPDISSLKEWFDLPDDIKKECLEHRIDLSDNDGRSHVPSLCHQYFLTQCLDNYKKYRSELAFQNIAMCFAMLEKFNIPYRFSFIYDIWNKNQYGTHGLAVKNKYHHMIDWSKFIDLPPFEFGIKHDLLADDGYHLTDAGMNRWADEIKKIMLKDPELGFLFAK